eukprot:481444-Prorocentrum_minimum.AAC.1
MSPGMFFCDFGFVGSAGKVLLNKKKNTKNLPAVVHVKVEVRLQEDNSQARGMNSLSRRSIHRPRGQNSLSRSHPGDILIATPKGSIAYCLDRLHIVLPLPHQGVVCTLVVIGAGGSFCASNGKGAHNTPEWRDAIRYSVITLTLPVAMCAMCAMCATSASMEAESLCLVFQLFWTIGSVSDADC